MTSPFDYRRDVEIPEDLLKRICQGQRESKDAVQLLLKLQIEKRFNRRPRKISGHDPSEAEKYFGNPFEFRSKFLSQAMRFDFCSKYISDKVLGCF